METPQENRLPPPPRPISSLQAGFDITASHVYLILVPVALDLFLWLGPRLRIEEFMRPMTRSLIAFLSQNGSSSADLADVQRLLGEFSRGFNMFGLAHTLPIGIPSLNYGRTFAQTPLRPPTPIEVTSMAGFWLGWVALTLVGWIGASLFYHWVAEATAPARWPGGLGRTSNSLVQGFLLCVFWTAILMAVTLPIVVFGAVLLQISPALAQVALLLGLFALVWVLPLIFFSGHGIFAYKQNLIQSIGMSLRMSRFTLPNSAMFILFALLISEGLTFLWRVPPTDSWLTLVGIMGHGFVTTALLAASFVYYRNVNAWLQIVMERLKAQPRSVSA
jgi:hypothetical protein